jgi:pre-mRNA-splicing factor ISY1
MWLILASLSDYQIRDINDEINKVMKEKYVWEIQLRNLGGPNYGIGTGGVMVDDQGREVPGQRGYKYYGRARELPGIPQDYPPVLSSFNHSTSLP